VCMCCCVGVCVRVCVCVCARARARVRRRYVFVGIVFAFAEFCLCVCMQQGRHIAHKFESGWEVGVIKAFDKKGPHAGKFSVKYKDDQNWWSHSFLREGYGKDEHWVLLRLLSRDSV
jgi:hypothetical protein